MPDYSKTIIYVIKCKDENVEDEYVGSTTNFSRRKREHKNDCNNKNSKNYQFIRANGGWDNFDMILLEEFPCNNRTEGRCREEEVKVERKAQLNMVKAFRAQEQKKEYAKEYNKIWFDENKENRKKQMKKWEEENKIKRREQSKIWREKNKERNKEDKKIYREKNKEQNKKWHEDNKEKIKELQKKWYETNKEKVKEKRKIYREKNKEKISEQRRLKYAEKKLLNNIHNEPAESD
jgi:hypothetical protein